jgi:hypothetical protein
MRTAVRPLERHADDRDLPLEHHQLMTEKKNLDLLLPLRATPKNEQLKKSPQRPVHQRHRNALRPTGHDR